MAAPHEVTTSSASERRLASFLTLQWRPFLAGALAGIVNVIVGHPLDTLKVRVQQGGTHSVWPAQRSALYAGVAGPLLTLPCLQGLSFGIYDVVRQTLSADWPDFFAHSNVDRSRRNAFLLESSSNLLSIFLAGTISGWAIGHVTIPMQNIKVQQQVAGHSLTMSQALQRVGCRGLCKGYVPHSIVEGVGRGFYMLGHVQSKRAFGVDRNSGDREKGSDLPKRILCGSIGGASAWCSTYPFDVIRSRLMGDWRGERYRGVVDCAIQIFRQEGVIGFYRGFQFTLARAVPVAAVTLPTYDLALSVLTRC